LQRQTCGSVRSSPSAPARLVTAGSEAAETMHLIFGCGNDREVVFVAASVKAVGGLDWMTRPNQVNCCKHRQTWRAKDAVRLQPKWYAASCSSSVCGHTDQTAAGVVSRG